MSVSVIGAVMTDTYTDPKCPVCKGNDGCMPCAYPSEGLAGCLRDQRLKGESHATIVTLTNTRSSDHEQNQEGQQVSRNRNLE